MAEAELETTVLIHSYRTYGPFKNKEPKFEKHWYL